MRFIATADWQLGMTAHYLPDEARARYVQARIDAIRTIGRVAADHQAEFVLVCGDVFESNQLDRQVVARTFDALSEVNSPVFLLPGNHDPLDAATIYRSAEFAGGCPPHVKVLDTPGRHPVKPGVEIVAAPWFSKAPLSDLVADAVGDLEPAADIVRIVAGHGTVLGIDRNNPAGINDQVIASAIDSGLVQFAVLGDRHSVTEITPRVWYPGTPEVTSRRETDPGHVLLVDIRDSDASVTPIRVGIWNFIEHERTLNSFEDVQDLERWFEAQPNKDRTAIWLSLTGTLTVGAKAALDDVIEQASHVYALVRFWDRHTDLAVLPADGEFRDLGLTGYAQDAVNELVELLDSSEADTARDALGLLYRLSGGRTV